MGPVLLLWRTTCGNYLSVSMQIWGKLEIEDEFANITLQDCFVKYVEKYFDTVWPVNKYHARLEQSMLEKILKWQLFKLH